MSVRQVNLDMVFADIRVNPSEDFLGLIEKDHVLIDYKIAVLVGKPAASINYCLDVGMSLLNVIQLLQLYDLLVSKLVNPDFL